MTTAGRKEQRIITYAPPYVKKEVTEYVNKTKDMSISKFMTAAAKAYLKEIKGTAKI